MHHLLKQQIRKQRSFLRLLVALLCVIPVTTSYANKSPIITEAKDDCTFSSAEAKQWEIYNIGGEKAYSQGRFLQAETLFNKALDEAKRLNLSVQTARTLNGLAVLYQNTGRLDQAEKIMKRAISILEKETGPQSGCKATYLNNLAQIYQDAKRFDEAEATMQKALQISIDSRGSDSPGTALILCNLGTYYSEETDDIKKGKKLLLQGVNNYENHNINSLSAAKCLGNLSLIFQKEKNYNEAESIQEKSLDMIETIVGVEHTTYAIGLFNLATIYKDEQRLSDAEDTFLRAFEILEKILGLNHSTTLLIERNVANFYLETKQSADAELFIKRNLQKLENQYGVKDKHLSGTIGNLLEVYAHVGKFTEFRNLYVRYAEIRNAPVDKLLGAAGFMFSKGEELAAQGDDHQAETMFNRALALLEAAKKEKSLETVKVLDAYAKLLRQNSRSEQATKLEEKSRQINSVARK